MNKTHCLIIMVNIESELFLSEELATMSTTLTNKQMNKIIKTDSAYWNKYLNQLPAILHHVNNAESVMWFPSQINWGKDRIAFQVLDEKSQHLIKYVLAFFATGDGIVNFNLLDRFLPVIKCSVARSFYMYQLHIEDVHARTYNDAISTLIDDQEERDSIIDALHNVPAIKNIGAFCLKYSADQSIEFRKLNFVYAIVEGIIFSASFCIIAYFKKINPDLEGLCLSNDFIQRDENMHKEFAAIINNTLQHPIAKNEAISILNDAMIVIDEFIDFIIPNPIGELSSKSLKTHVRSIADILLKEFNFKPVYEVQSPYKWFAIQQLPPQTSFFERKGANYSTNTKLNNDKKFTDDF